MIYSLLGYRAISEPFLPAGGKDNAAYVVAIDHLYNAPHGSLHDLLRRRLGCSETAANLAHDAFLRLLLQPRRFDSAERARAYLSGMARRRCIDYWRRREIEQAYLET